MSAHGMGSCALLRRHFTKSTSRFLCALEPDCCGLSYKLTPTPPGPLCFLAILDSVLCLQERASADSCRGLVEQEGGPHDAGGSPLDAFAWGSIVLGNRLDISSEFDRRLSIGASIACRLRGAIRKELGDAPAPGRTEGPTPGTPLTLHVDRCCSADAEPQLQGACTAASQTLVQWRREKFRECIHLGGQEWALVTMFCLGRSSSLGACCADSHVSAGFTSSAGIAANKLLAKISSALNKPNQQTLVPPRYLAFLCCSSCVCCPWSALSRIAGPYCLHQVVGAPV